MNKELQQFANTSSIRQARINGIKSKIQSGVFKGMTSLEFGNWIKSKLNKGLLLSNKKDLWAMFAYKYGYAAESVTIPIKARVAISVYEKEADAKKRQTILNALHAGEYDDVDAPLFHKWLHDAWPNRALTATSITNLAKLHHERVNQLPSNNALIEDKQPSLNATVGVKSNPVLNKPVTITIQSGNWRTTITTEQGVAITVNCTEIKQTIAELIH